MNGSATRFTLRSATLLLAAALLFVAALVVAGCSSGGSGGISIGSGQAPDPATVDFPIAYVKRALPTGQEDLRVQRTFQAGADVWLRDRAAPTALEHNLTGALTGGRWDVRDLDVSWDGARLVFSMRAPPVPGARESEQPTWRIYEYDRSTQVLRRVIASDLVAQEGHDVCPHYLPDGRIVFASTRQRQSKAVLIDEGKPQFAALDEDRREWAFNLHVMNPDGSGIRQITFNQSHDLCPAVLNDGRIVFTHWEDAGSSSMHLYAVNPDGSGLALLYGANSHDTGSGGSTVQFVVPRPRADGSVVALIRPFGGTESGGDIVSIDAARFVENAQPTLANAGLAGPGQRKLTTNDVRTVEGLSPGGRYASVFPLWDGTDRLLVSWSLCRIAGGGGALPCTDENLATPGVVAAPALYGVFMFDPRDNTQRPIFTPVEGVMLTDVVAMQPRVPLPPVILDRVAGIDFDSDLATEGVGEINILSVYDLDGVDAAPGGIPVLRDPALTRADQRPARFLRIEKAVSIPDDDVRAVPGAAFGAAGGLGMREILGYAPIEPDGSVRIKVPADVAFQVTVLDAAGRRISPRHLNWLQLRAGEVLTCSGCHRPAGQQPAGQSRISHGRPGLFVQVNPGAPTTGQPFPHTLPALFANQGETMAEVRARISCQDNCAALRPTTDVVFEDSWTDPATAGRAPDPSFAWRYADLATPAPTSAACSPGWSAQCRITIHYPAHIAPLWALDRRVFNAGGAVTADHTCTGCHSTRDATGAVRVPAAQLDLSPEPSPDQSYQMTSYRELLFGDNAQEVDMGALRDILVPGPVDPVTGQPTLVPVPVPAPMTAAGARASTRFFDRFDAGGTHVGFMSNAELRLVAEWLDIGAQYYNDPFTAPED